VTAVNPRAPGRDHIDDQEVAMRKALYTFGWVVLLSLPVIFAIQIYVSQDLPKVEPWKWLVLFGAVLLIYFSRDRDDVLKHHVV
jgi:hypothetical protein